VRFAFKPVYHFRLFESRVSCFKCGRKGHVRAASTSHETNSQVHNSQCKPNSGNGVRIFYCKVSPASAVRGVVQLQESSKNS